jgi:hypothetical protein
MSIPDIDVSGSFSKALAPVPDDWPWVFPHYYAVNIVSDPKVAVVGWTASPDGEDQPRTAFVAEHSKMEVIAFWQNAYRIISVKDFLRRADAEQQARDYFRSIPTKYLMLNGQMIEENQSITLTGDWPSNWEFSEIRDLGVFFCYLVLSAQSKGAIKQAQKVKESLLPAWPQTELILSYQKAFEVAQEELGLVLSSKENELIDEALNTISRWLRQ